MTKPYETLSNAGGQWDLHAQPDCEQCLFQARLRNRGQARKWLQQFKSDKKCMEELRSLLARESDVILRVDRASEDAILDQAARMFEIGRWFVHAPHQSHLNQRQGPASDSKGAPGSGGSAGAATARAATPEKTVDLKKQKPTTWLSIELVDMEGNPVPGQKYEVRWLGKVIKSGKLDGKGCARLDGIEQDGYYEVSFVDLDKEAWQPAPDRGETA